MLAPTLLIGLGGTGSKIVCKVANMVTEEQRQRIGFAVFDTDINELREIREKNSFIKTIQTSTKLSVGEYLNIDTHARDIWFPVNAILNSKTLTEGAGQVRAISRLAFDTAIRAGNLEPLHAAIEDLYKLEEEQSDQALRVVIVSSLAGGTGSGLILPVALYVKNFLAARFQQSANITRGFFILPEVFYEVIRSQSERNNLRCNAYATIRELDAFLMKGDYTLPDKYEDTVKIEFPRVGSAEFEEYPVRPYDFCFLFDAQNTEGKKLNDFNQYLDHAANCIYSQSIGPMNKRSNSSEDNTIRELCAQSGRNRYAGAGSSMLIYPFEKVKEYIALKWTQECVSDQWLVFDRGFKEKKMANAEMRSRGYAVKDIDEGVDYIESVDAGRKNRNPFAMSIYNQCYEFDEDGLNAVSPKWEKYIGELKKHVELLSESSELNAQEEVFRQNFSNITGGSDTWDILVDTYRAADKYHSLVEKRCDDTAKSIAYSLFKAKNDSATKDKHPHQLETYLRDTKGDFIHPNAVRYFLYNTFILMSGELLRVNKEMEDYQSFFDNFEKTTFDDPKTDDVVETVDSLSERKAHRKLSGDQKELKDKIQNYMVKVKEYRVVGIWQAVLVDGIAYVKDLSEAFQAFFNSFESKITEISRNVQALSKQFDHSKGNTKRYVCASEKCLARLVKECPYTGSTVSIDSDLADSIYNKVRNYSMLREKPDEKSDYFGEIFKNGIIKYFKDKLMESYKTTVDMDIITALEKEAEYEGNKCDTQEIENYVKHVITETRNLSHPFIERPLGEQKEPIQACTFNPAIDPKDDSPRNRLIRKELMNFGGVADKDIDRGMIMFYQSIYGLRANRLSKFAPASDTGRGEGEYFKAYFELINQIKPKSDKTPVITPHIDRTWHIISALPDLDESNQTKQENKIYKAFLYGFLLGMIDYQKISEGKYLYRLYLKGCNPEDFVVSNKTPCDNFYEVLDALTINPVIVNNIIASAERQINKEISGTAKINFKDSKFKKALDELEVKEFKKDGLTLFDLATLLKVSTPSAEFDKNVGTSIMKIMLETIYNYMALMTPGNELNYEFGKFVFEQYEKFDANIDWYLSNWNDNFSEYIDDMIRVASEILEDKELDGILDDIRAHRKEALRRRA